MTSLNLSSKSHILSKEAHKYLKIYALGFGMMLGTHLQILIDLSRVCKNAWQKTLNSSTNDSKSWKMTEVFAS